MLFLSEQEKRDWRVCADTARARHTTLPGTFDGRIRRNLIPAFHFYTGTILAADGQGRRACEWLNYGARRERDGLSCCRLLSSFLERHAYRMAKPAIVFSDPRPFIHFANVPGMTRARREFIRQCGNTLPGFSGPIRFMDIGCGDGALTAALLLHLVENGNISALEEICLIDPSPAMTAIAEKTVKAAFPDAAIRTVNGRIQDCSGKMAGRYDIALSSFAYHHMPVEEKRIHLARLKPKIDHFVLFDMEGDHDTPEQHAPELALSVYQTYGRMTDFVCSAGTPEELVNDCMDAFLMTEIISILTEPRGVRSDYHMLRSQWNDLFASVLGPEFTRLCDSAPYADEAMEILTLHYGRSGEGTRTEEF